MGCSDECNCTKCSMRKNAFIYTSIFALFVYFLTKNVKLTLSVLLGHYILFQLL